MQAVLRGAGSLPSFVDRGSSPAKGNRAHPKTGTQEVWDRFHREGGFGLVAFVRGNPEPTAFSWILAVSLRGP